MQPPESLRDLPLLSSRCALRERGQRVCPAQVRAPRSLGWPAPRPFAPCGANGGWAWVGGAGLRRSHSGMTLAAGWMRGGSARSLAWPAPRAFARCGAEGGWAWVGGAGLRRTDSWASLAAGWMRGGSARSLAWPAPRPFARCGAEGGWAWVGGAGLRRTDSWMTLAAGWVRGGSARSLAWPAPRPFARCGAEDGATARRSASRISLAAGLVHCRHARSPGQRAWRATPRA